MIMNMYFLILIVFAVISIAAIIRVYTKKVHKFPDSILVDISDIYQENFEYKKVLKIQTYQIYHRDA